MTELNFYLRPCWGQNGKGQTRSLRIEKNKLSAEVETLLVNNGVFVGGELRKFRYGSSGNVPNFFLQTFGVGDFVCDVPSTISRVNAIIDDNRNLVLLDYTNGPVKSNPWAYYEEKYKAAWRVENQKRDKLNPRQSPLPVSRYRRNNDSFGPNSRIPAYAIYGMKEEANYTCPILGLREGQFVRKGNKVLRIELTNDHSQIPRSEGGRTVPENSRIVSNLANMFRSNAKLSDDEVKFRYQESGYQVFHVIPEHADILSQYGIKAWTTK